MPVPHERVSCEILITNACNLRCGYCIAENLPGPAMTREVGCKALDMFTFLAEGATSLEITFTGGEPLLEFALLEELTDYANERALKAGMDLTVVLKTNGTILTEAILAFMRGRCSKVVVSIDGDCASHDAYRKNTSGIGTHGVVRQNLLTLLHNDVPCAVSATVHPRFCERVPDNVQYLHELGVRQIDIGPAYGTVTWHEAEIQALTDSLERVACYMRQANRSGAGIEIGPLYRESEHVGEVLSDCWGCRAASTNLAYLPNGQISGCSALAMLASRFPEVVLGDVCTGLNDAAVTHFLRLAQAGPNDRKGCKGCQASPNCTGGCLAINYSTNGTPLAPPEFYCQTIAKIPMAWHQAWAGLVPGL
jgi:uncharacterized protein